MFVSLHMFSNMNMCISMVFSQHVYNHIAFTPNIYLKTMLTHIFTHTHPQPYMSHTHTQTHFTHNYNH